MTDAPMERDRLWDLARILLSAIVLVIALWAIQRGLTFRPLAAYFPVAAAGMVALFTAIQMVVDIANFLRGRLVIVPGLDVKSPIHGMGVAGLLLALRYMGWFVGYILLMYVTGVFVSTALFIGAFLKLEARWHWPGVAVLVVASLLVVYAMLGGLDLGVPRTVFDIGHGVF